MKMKFSKKDVGIKVHYKAINTIDAINPNIRTGMVVETIDAINPNIRTGMVVEVDGDDKEWAKIFDIRGKKLVDVFIDQLV